MKQLQALQNEAEEAADMEFSDIPSRQITHKNRPSNRPQDKMDVEENKEAIKPLSHHEMLKKSRAAKAGGHHRR